MIKKWDNFIKESVDYKSIKTEIDKITNDKFGLPDIEKRGQLISIFENGLKIENQWLHIIKVLYLYTEYVYNDKSNNIKLFLESFFIGDKFQSVSWFSDKLYKKSVSEISSILIKTLEFYEDIENELKEDGYPNRSDLSIEIESICKDSLDYDILEFYEVIESHSGFHVDLGYDSEDLSVELLQKITDEVVTLSPRISDSTGLKNTWLEMNSGNLSIGFEFKN